MFLMNPEGEKVLGLAEIGKVGIVITVLFLCHWMMRNSSMSAVSKKTPSWVLGIGWGILFFLICLAQGSGEQFIYFQF